MAALFESGFVVKEAAWHGEAKVLREPPSTAEDALVEAGCDWEVEKRRLYLADGTAVPGFATVRTKDARVLGVVGPAYTVVQNRMAFQWFDPFLREGKIEFHTGGSLCGGRRVWIQAFVLGEQQDVVPGDLVRAYLLLSNSHDGSLGVDVRFTPVRVVCNNTLTAARTQEVPRLQLRHTAHVEQNLVRIRDVVDLARRAFRDTVGVYRDLAAVHTGPEEKVRAYVRQVFTGNPLTEVPRTETAVFGLIYGGRGQDLPGVGGTWWGALNGVTEYLDHERGRPVTRLDQSWFGEGVRTRQRAVDLAIEYAKAA